MKLPRWSRVYWCAKCTGPTHTTWKGKRIAGTLYRYHAACLAEGCGFVMSVGGS